VGRTSSTYDRPGLYSGNPWNDSCAGKLLASYESGSSVAYGKKLLQHRTGDGYMTVTAAPAGQARAPGTASAKDVTSGSCQGWAKPKWQSLGGVPSDGVRDIPDVSLFAANGVWGHYYVYCFSDPDNGGSSAISRIPTGPGRRNKCQPRPILGAFKRFVGFKNADAREIPTRIYYRSEPGMESKGKSSCNSSLGKDVPQAACFTT